MLAVGLGVGAVIGAAVGDAVALETPGAVSGGADHALAGAAIVGSTLVWVGMTYGRFQQEFDEAFQRMVDAPRLNPERENWQTEFVLPSSFAAALGLMFVLASMYLAPRLLPEALFPDDHGVRTP
jgi:hypothetical protein